MRGSVGMSSVFPGAIDDFDVSMSPTGLMNSPSHAVQHQKIGDALEKIEAHALGTTPFVFQLAGPGNLAQGSTSVPTTTAPPPWLQSRDYAWFIDPGPNCERLFVQTITGTTLTLEDTGANPASHTPAPTKLTHTVGATILVVPVGSGISPQLYGAKGDNRSDSWRALQRCFLENSAEMIFGGGAGTWRSYVICQPLFWPDETRIMGNWHIALGASDQSPPFDYNCCQQNVPTGYVPTGNSFGIGDAETHGPFTVSGGVLNVGTGLTLTVGSPVAVNNPYSESLPSQLNSGRQYVWKAYNSSTGVAQIAQCATPSTAITLTDGAGFFYTNYSSHKHIYTHGSILRLDVHTAGHGIDGIHFGNLNQPSELGCIRVEQDPSSDNTVWGILRDGQLSHAAQVEAQGGGSRPWYEAGTGHVTEYASTNQATGGAISLGGNACRYGHLHVEQVAVGVQLRPDVRGLVIDNVYWANVDGNTLFQDADGAGTSYKVGPVVVASGGSTSVLFAINGCSPITCNQGNIEDGVGAIDAANTFGGLYKVGTSGGGGVKLLNRGAYYWHNAASFKTRQLFEDIYWYYTTGTGTIRFPPLVGFDGAPFYIDKQSGQNLICQDSLGNVLSFSPLVADGLYAFRMCNEVGTYVWRKVVS